MKNMNKILSGHDISIGLCGEKLNYGTMEWFEKSTGEYRMGFATSADAYRNAAEYILENYGDTLPELNDEDDPELSLAIEMVSEEYGSKLFRYGNPEERIAGLHNLMEKTAALKDGIERKFYFGEVGPDNEFYGGDVEIVAKWNGESWDFAEHGEPGAAVVS